MQGPADFGRRFQDQHAGTAARREDCRRQAHGAAAGNDDIPPIRHGRSPDVSRPARTEHEAGDYAAGTRRAPGSG